MTPVERLMARRAKLRRGEHTDMTGLSPEEAEGVHQAAREQCEDVKRYLKELHYSLYCCFLQNNAPAYVEVPKKFRPFLSPVTLGDMLHKLHGRLIDRVQFLSDHPDVTAARHYPMQQATSSTNLRPTSPQSPAEGSQQSFAAGALNTLRSSLCRRLYNVALSEWPVEDLPDDDAILAAPPTSVLIIPLIERGFLILKQEYDGSDDELASYFSERDGLVFHAVRRWMYFNRLGVVEGERAAAEKMREESERLAKLAAEFAARNNATDTMARSSVDGNASFNDSFSPTASVKTSVPLATQATATVAPAPTAVAFCPRCNTCSICCVCSLVFSPEANRIRQSSR